ncbi:hypothetical protein BTM25_41990 [Actinomadura rubteroloni]|uniref:PE-PGRS family protein n=1 Tax=Actinomadura rubteroloni TaxID=1926885 RepID=A0A2P4UKG8_9ACTN|nr:DUF5954 family protein [Actinomadura rubteroloni]POM25551.1 hypothetical protein BTM25_41990 [Actinomadura rubteroloni]
MTYIAGGDGAALDGDLPPTLDEVVRSPRAAERMGQLNYPKVIWSGVNYVIAELVDGVWLLDDPVCDYPQEARDAMGFHFRALALRRSTPAAAREEYWETSALLERERPNELTVAGRRFRVVRVDRFSRVGPLGPESPRATDPDDVPDERPADMHAHFCRHPLPEPVTPGSAELLGERWEHIPRAGRASADVIRDARRALGSHPLIVRLAPRFIVLNNMDGFWSTCRGYVTCPRAARATLADILRAMTEEDDEDLSEDDRSAILRTAEALGIAPIHEVVLRGEIRYRIVRVEHIVRMNDDGPEPSRPSDHDPEEPLTGETAELRTWPLRDE